MTWAGGAVLLLLLLLIAVQLGPRILARRTVGRSLHGIPGSLGAAIDAGEDVIVVFFGPTCTACRRQEPAVQAVQKDFPSLFLINVPEELSTARTFGVMATPTTVLVRNRTIQKVLVGVQSESTLRSLVQRARPRR